MVQTALDVCNLSIDRIGGERIEKIGEDTPLGAFCQRGYSQARDWLLSKHRWTFAKRIRQLARRSVTPDGWPAAYAFDLPSDLVGAVWAFRSGPRPNDHRVEVLMEADGVASDAPVIWIEYTAAVPESTWPVAFVELVVTAFAANLAINSLNRSLADDLRQQAFGLPGEGGEGGLLLSAKAEDSRDAPQRTLAGVDQGELVNSRFGFGEFAPFRWFCR